MKRKTLQIILAVGALALVITALWFVFKKEDYSDQVHGSYKQGILIDALHKVSPTEGFSGVQQRELDFMDDKLSGVPHDVDISQRPQSSRTCT